MSGVAMQSAGLYLCLVLWAFTATAAVSRGVRRALLSAASLLAVLYLIPVVVQSLVAISSNPLQYCFVDPPQVKNCDLDLKAWTKSPVSSSFLGLAIGWFVFVLTRKQIPSGRAASAPSSMPVWSDDEQRLRSFARGLLFASILFFSYALYQHATGFSAVLKGKVLADEHRMPSGLYRVFGFYGHPLSVAGASLVWMSFSLVGFVQSTRQSNVVLGPTWKTWLCVSVLQSALVYMSGGRTAFLVCLLFWMAALGILALRFALSGRSAGHAHGHQGFAFPRAWFAAILTAVASLIVAGITFFPQMTQIVSTLFSRGLGGGTLGQGPLGDRPFFWQVYLAMWRDSPFLGQGYFAVEHGLRTHYYVREGFASLRDKFNSHNIFLEILGISGLLGFFAYLIVCVLLWINLKVLAGLSPQRRFVLRGLGVAFVANLLHGLTQNTFFDSAVSSCYLGLVGLLVLPPFKSSN
jgi:O-antigen ligase